jgi:hypothetical protein
MVCCREGGAVMREARQRSDTSSYTDDGADGSGEGSLRGEVTSLCPRTHVFHVRVALGVLLVAIQGIDKLVRILDSFANSQTSRSSRVTFTS